MTLRIMGLNMCELRRILEGRNIPIQMSQPLMNIRISRSDIPDVRLEVLDVDCVEANHGGVETDVCFCNVRPVVERTFGFGEMVLDSI